MSFRIGVVAEADADLRTVSTLIDRKICESDPPDWITAENISDYRSYHGIDDTEVRLKWTVAERLRDKVFLPITAKKSLTRGEALTAFRALMLFATLPSHQRVDAVILSRDTDDQRERRDALLQARKALNLAPDGTNNGFRVVLAVAHTKRECWHICGFQPSDAEQIRVTQLCTGEDALGFNPLTDSHELTASHDETHDKRSAKRVLNALTETNARREAQCLEAPFPLLLERGQHNGLAEFLKEIDAILLPMFGGRSVPHAF
jgi:hypothetical protein